MRRLWRAVAPLGVMAAMGLTAGAAQAERSGWPAGTPAAWKQECSACHVAYPPQMLARSGWSRLLGSLDHHFGSDASLSADDVRALQGFVARYGSPDGGRADAADGRITATVWFRRAHAELPAGAFRDPAVMRASRCEACHGRAESGSFRERELTPLGRRFGDD